MDEADFLKNYLTESNDQLDPRFVHEMPPVTGLEKDGKLIIRAEHKDTLLDQCDLQTRQHKERDTSDRGL